ncbi:MAG: CPBP family intramembrane glutamic endopeptidase [Ilumatobacteraceae bacterium]
MRPASHDAGISIAAAAATWLGAYIAALPLQAGVIGLLGQSGVDPDDWPTSTMVATVLCLWVPFVVGLVVLGRRRGSGSIRDAYRVRFRVVDLVGLPIGVVGQFVLVPLLYWPLTTLFPDAFDPAKVEERATDLWNRADGWWVLALIAVVAIGAPLVEEFVYRGVILQSLEGRLNDTVALVVSAAFFGAIHLQPVEFPGLFVIGIVFGLCWQRSGRIACPILAHLAFNASGLLLAAN